MSILRPESLQGVVSGSRTGGWASGRAAGQVAGRKEQCRQSRGSSTKHWRQQLGRPHGQTKQQRSTHLVKQHRHPILGPHAQPADGSLLVFYSRGRRGTWGEPSAVFWKCWCPTTCRRSCSSEHPGAGSRAPHFSMPELHVWLLPGSGGSNCMVPFCRQPSGSVHTTACAVSGSSCTACAAHTHTHTHTNTQC
jgi:hypothetical protein